MLGMNFETTMLVAMGVGAVIGLANIASKSKQEHQKKVDDERRHQEILTSLRQQGEDSVRQTATKPNARWMRQKVKRRG